MRHCCNLFKSTSVAVSGSNLLVTLPNNISFENASRLCFIICQSIPEEGKTLPVVLQSGAATASLWDKYGNIAVGSELKTRCVIRGYVGSQSDAVHVISSIPSGCSSCTGKCFIS